jgi:hypothetical protein
MAALTVVEQGDARQGEYDACGQARTGSACIRRRKRRSHCWRQAQGYDESKCEQEERRRLQGKREPQQ